jgi:hypothetical protein
MSLDIAYYLLTVNKMLKHKPNLDGIIRTMQNNLKAMVRTLKLQDRKHLTVAAALILILIVGFFISQAMMPKRSVAAYCKVYKEEKTRLAKLPGDTYPSLLFDHPISDAGEFVTSLARLEKVAPNDIDSDIKTLESLYRKLNSDPSQMVSVSFAAEPVDKSASNWTNTHCKVSR